MNQATTVDQAGWIIEPYSAIPEISMGNAAWAGYFQEQERTATAAFLGRNILRKLFEPRCDRIATPEPWAREIPQMREIFKAEQPELAVRSALRGHRKERPRRLFQDLMEYL